MSLNVVAAISQGHRKGGGPSQDYLRGGGISPPKKNLHGNNFTEYSVKVVIEAFENKYKFKIYMRKSLYIYKVYFKVIARQLHLLW